MNIASIAMLVAVIVLFGGACFVKNKSLNFLLQAFGFVSLLGLGAVVGNSQNNFSGFVVFLLVSVAPQFLHLFDMESYIKSKQQDALNAENVETNLESQDDKKEVLADKAKQENVETFENNEEISNEENVEESIEVEEKPKKNHFLTSNGVFLSGIANILTAGCVTFAGLYLGLETFYGALFGVATGFAIMFLVLAMKKEINLFDIIGATLSFVAVGLLLGSIITVILYSVSLTNILFCLGCLAMATSFALQALHKTRFDNLIYCVGMICLFATLLF